MTGINEGKNIVQANYETSMYNGVCWPHGGHPLSIDYINVPLLYGASKALIIYGRI